MRRGGHAIWKTQVWIMLFIIVVCVIFLTARAYFDKRQNYREWRISTDRRITELEKRCP